MVLTEGRHKYDVNNAVERIIGFASSCASHEDVSFVEVVVKDKYLEVNYKKDDGNPHWINNKGNWSRYICENEEEVKSVKRLLKEFARENKINGNNLIINFVGDVGFYFYQ